MGVTIQFESHRVELVYYIIYAEVLNGRSFCRLSTIAPRHWQARAIDLLHGETRVVGVGVSEPRLTVRSGEQVAAAAEARIPGETP